MNRIDSPGAVNGRFSDGNPASGQRATVVSAAWLNALQETILNPIEQAGINLDIADNAQLYNAIVTIATGIAEGIAGGAGEGTTGVPPSRSVTGGGLVTGGGDLSVNRILSVAAASAAEISAGTRDDVAITPLGLAGGQGARQLANTGYLPIIGGGLLQWGSAFAQANGSTVVNFPISFPGQCVFATFSGGAAFTNAQENDPFVSGVSAGAATIFNANDNSVSGRFFALGY